MTSLVSHLSGSDTGASGGKRGRSVGGVWAERLSGGCGCWEAGLALLQRGGDTEVGEVTEVGEGNWPLRRLAREWGLIRSQACAVTGGILEKAA